MIVLIPLQLIDDNPFQTRAAYAEEAIRELADSIRGLRDVRPETCGLIHVPPARVVDALEPGGPVDPRHALVTDESMETYRYQVAAGHSRLRAFRLLAGDDPEAWGAMPLDLGVLDDQAMADVAWAENQKRKDLSAIEEARALQAAMSRFNWTQEQVAERWKLARSTVANKVRLLGLPQEVQDKVIAGEIGERAVRALLPALDAGVASAVKSGLDKIAAGGSPDAVEQDVTWELKRRSQSLSGDGALWPAEWPGERLGLKVPACQGCRHRRKIDKEWRCFDTACYKRKLVAWNAHQVGLAIAAHQDEAGKPLVTYDNWNYDQVHFEDRDEQASLKATCLPGCKHGRLGFTAQWPLWMRTANRGTKAKSGEAWFVCDKKRCMQGLQGRGAVSAEERKRRDAEKKARQDIELAIAQVLDELHPAEVALLPEFPQLRQALIDRLQGAISDNGLRSWLGKRMSAEDLGTAPGLWRAVLAWWLAGAVGYSIWSGTTAEDTVGKRAQALWAYLRPGGVSAETQVVALAVQLEALANASAEWIDGMDEALPGQDELAEQLAAVVGLEEQAEGAEGAEAIRAELARQRACLETLKVILEDWDGADLEHVSWLVHTPPENINFRSHLERASMPAIGYALALSRGKDQNKTRVERLEREIRKRAAQDVDLIMDGIQSIVGPAWTCCVCGQAFGEDVAVGLALLDGDEHPRAGAFLCEACLRDTAAGGAALGVEGLAAAAHFVLQQGEWATDVCILGRPCLLCGQKKDGFGAGGWTLREMPAGRAHDIQLCPACAAAGRAYQVTAWSPNGKNPHLSHYWSYQQDGSWASACGQVQPVPWRPEADTAKHCASCARIVKAETG